MAEEETPFTWKGRDGLIYELSTVEDRHLRFFHRMIREGIEEENRALNDNSRPVDTDRLEKRHRICFRVSKEISRRGLTSLPVRTPQEIAQAKLRTQQRQQTQENSQKSWGETLEEAGQVLQARAVAQAFGPGSQGVGGGLLGGLGAGIGGAFGSLTSGSGIQTVPTPAYNPRHKQFAHGKVAPVEDTTPVIETETPRHIRLPRKKKEIS